jgi:hypothetical protein
VTGDPFGDTRPPSARHRPLTDPDDNYKTIAEGQHPKHGNGLIGGDRQSQGGGGGQRRIGPDLTARWRPGHGETGNRCAACARLCQRHFRDSKLGKFSGTLSLDDVALEGSAVTPHPAIAISFRSFDMVCGEPVQCTVSGSAMPGTPNYKSRRPRHRAAA